MNKFFNPFINIAYVELPIATEKKAGSTFLSDLRELNIGNGTQIFRADEQGIWLGAKTFANAPFKVNMAGAVIATAITITGGTLKYGKTSFTDTTHAGYYLGSEGVYIGKINDETVYKFTISDGSLQYKGKVVAGTGSDIPAGYITGSIVASQIGSVYASVISGTITASQISSVNASAITGSIVASQIASVNATAISGSITASQISSVNATVITGLITNSQIGSVSASVITGSITAGQITSITAGQITGQIISDQITNLAITAGKIDNLTITADKIANTTITGGKIAGNTITADKLSVTYLSAISANLGTVTGGTFKVSTRISIQKSDGTAIGYLGQDPDTTNMWGFIAERGYGLMCRYTGTNYFRIYMDSASTDAVIDMPSPDKIKIQDNAGNAIMRFYGRAAGFSNLGGLDMFGPIRLYTASTPPTNASNGMLFYHTTYHEVWVFKNGAWKALAYVP